MKLTVTKTERWARRGRPDVKPVVLKAGTYDTDDMEPWLVEAVLSKQKRQAEEAELEQGNFPEQEPSADAKADNTDGDGGGDDNGDTDGGSTAENRQRPARPVRSPRR